ncbi:uncharacterized protein LOC109599422 [Aethina tumida]|uniref:uncharacterized protein LOC109599422 n=1 Tax=Aethina tumida TaxID=116153 RepID=UPI00096B1805|nr:uncharacterized protein LOC109599422 [Aethina tumida]
MEGECAMDDESFQEPEVKVPPIIPDSAYYDYHVSRMIRKNSPDPEDDEEAIERVLDEFDKLDAPATVQEFVTFVGPYTKDEGATLRKVMEEEMTKFEKLQNEVYKPLLDDTADILMNEDLQRAKKYADEEAEVNSKILDMVSEIYRMVPTFNFKEFFTNPNQYLAKTLPFPAETNDDTDIKMQGLYHRYKWLENELSRLQTENREMELKLSELKAQLKRQRQKTSRTIDQADIKRQCLVNQEAEIKDALAETNIKLNDMMLMLEHKNRKENEQDIWEYAFEAKREKDATPGSTTSDSECHCE